MCRGNGEGLSCVLGLAGVGHRQLCHGALRTEQALAASDPWRSAGLAVGCGQIQETRK